MNKVRKLIYIILINYTLNALAGGSGGGGGVRPVSVKLQGGTHGGGVLEINPRKKTISLIGGNGGGGGARPFSIELTGGNSGSGGAKPISYLDGGHEL